MPRTAAPPSSPPSPEPKKTGPAAASGAASSTSSPYLGDPGPGFDPSKAPPAAEQQPAGDVAAFSLGWEEPQVRDWLHNAGDLAHAAFGVGERDWAMTKADLDRIAPPATRILNRFEPTAAIAAYSDPAAVAIGFGLYGWRSALERIAVKRAEDAEPDDQAPPVAPRPPMPGPDPNANGAGPQVADGFIPAAQRLRPNQRGGTH